MAAKRRRRAAPSRAPVPWEALPLDEVLERLGHAMAHLRDRLATRGQEPLVRQTVALMRASADGAPVDVQYEAVLHLALHVVQSMVTRPCYAPPADG